MPDPVFPSERKWLMERSSLESMMQRIAAAQATLASPRSDELEDLTRAANKEPGYEIQNGKAVIPLRGVIMNSVPWYFSFLDIPAVNVNALREVIRKAVQDEAADEILLDVESPGGEVWGTQETADAIYEANRVKPVHAHVSNLAASGAYWLSSQAGRITANDTAEVGSIGVYMVYVDMSKRDEKEGYKVVVIRSGEFKGIGLDEITEAQIESEQRIVDGLAGKFVAAVARGRSMDVERVGGLATGQTWLAQEAGALGLIDGIQSFDSALAGVPSALFSQGMEDNKMAGEKKPEAPSVDVDKVRDEARAEGERAAVQRLEALQAAFPDHPDFAMSMWKAGKSVEDAKVEHYEVVKGELAEAKAWRVEREEADAKAAETKAEEDKRKAEIAAAGEAGAEDKALGHTEDGEAPDFMAMAEAHQKEKGGSLSDAMSAVAAKNPAAYEKYANQQA